MENRAAGTFEVKLEQKDLDPGSEGTPLARMSIDKVFSGDISATSRGEMLSAMTPVKGSAGYVAMERVTGTVQGKRGSFVLQHTGTMNRGTPTLVITVVPDSGTGELEGLTGSFSIDQSGGSHAYFMEYSLREPAKES